MAHAFVIASYSLLTVTLLQHTGGIQPTVFLSEPQDVCILEGEGTYFPCIYTGTTVLPYWKINGSLYPTNRLPGQHHYNGTGLIVHSISMSMNMQTYACLFQVSTSEGVMLLSSRTATLTVYFTVSMSAGECSISTMAQYVILCAYSMCDRKHYSNVNCKFQVSVQWHICRYVHSANTKQHCCTSTTWRVQR